MSKINLPELMPFENFVRLSPKTREKYIHETIKEILNINGHRGVTIPEIEKNTYLSRKTIEKHLAELKTSNEVYVREFGKRKLYYPNSRLIHDTINESIELDDKKINIHLIENPFGRFIYLHETEESEYGNEVKGGIIIPEKKFEKFKEFIENVFLKISKGVNKCENTEYKEF